MPRDPRPPDAYMMPTPDFNELVKAALTIAIEHILKDKLKGYIPTAHLYFLDPQTFGKKNMIALMPDFDIKHRYKYMDAFGERIAQEGHFVMAIVLVSEAWRTVGPEPLSERPMPRDDPKRMETITAMGQSVEGRLAMGHCDIKRNRKDIMIPQEIEFTPYDEANPNDAHSDLCNAFWGGYRRGLLENIMSTPGGKEMINRLKEKASGSDPEAQNFKFN